MPYRPLPADERRRVLAGRVYAVDEPPPWIDEELLRPGQVAALFQVSRRTISDWARAGKLEAIITPGGHRRFRAPQVRALLDAQRIAATQPAEHGTLAPRRPATAGTNEGPLARPLDVVRSTYRS